MSIKTLRNSEYEKEMTVIRKYCITKSPGFAGVALLPNYFIIDPKDEAVGNEYGLTDGRSIYLGTKLFKESPKAQAFVIIHEVLHVALRHPQRGLALRQKRLLAGRTWSSAVYNWACDAIVNFSLGATSAWTNKPGVGLITFESLLPEDVLKNKPPHKWGVEELFKYLMDEVIQPAIDKAKADGLGPESFTAWGERLPGGGKRMLDIATPESGGVQPDSREEARNWNGRVTRAAAGDRPGGVMKEILFDVPQTKTPWRYILRQYVSEAVMPQTQVRPSRPSRQTLILDAVYKETKNTSFLPFSPGYRPLPGIRKMVVIVDTSGSITDELCEAFAAEISTIRKRVGCDLMLMTCDTEVHQRIDIKAHENLHNVIRKHGGFKGRGGTDFRTAVAEAENVSGAAVIVYLTDMQGPYPDKCRIPLVWASIMEKYTKPPCGKVVVLHAEGN